MAPTCDTFTLLTGRCGLPATMRMTVPGTSLGTDQAAFACEQHAARWLRVRRVRGTNVATPVHPNITAERITR